MKRSSYFLLACGALFAGMFAVSGAIGSASAESPVEGSVESQQYVETADTVFRIVSVDVDGQDVAVATMGGPRADGTMLVVSHQPELTVGSVVRLEATEPLNDEAMKALRAAGYKGEVPLVVLGGEESEVVVEEARAGRAHRVTGWKVTSMPIEYTIASSGLSTAVRNGIGLWEKDNCSRVDANYTGTAVGSFAVDGKNTVSWQSSSKFPDPTMLGMASVAYRDGKVVEWDIGFNSSASFSSSPTDSRYDIQSVAAHEFGHVLGLAHATTTSELMWAILPIGERKLLASGDITGLRSLYGASCTNPTPTPTPTPTPRPPAGGTPLCYGSKVTVDMTKGQKPTEGPDVIWGTMRRDVIDGKGGNDIICGRGGNDYIRGGDGGDKIYGMLGDDQLLGDDGRDRLFGGPGDDKLYGGNHIDRLFGDRGADYLNGGNHYDRCFGGPQRDRNYACELRRGFP